MSIDLKKLKEDLEGKATMYGVPNLREDIYSVIDELARARNMAVVTKEAFEYIQEEVDGLQGEWLAVDAVHAPTDVQTFKEISSKCTEVIKAIDEK